MITRRTRLALDRLISAGLAVALLACSGCVWPLPTPEGRAGRLVGTDGRPVVGATVVVESLDVMQPPGNDWPGTPVRRVETRTDDDGRWEVPGQLALRFGIPVPHLMPLQVDEYTFTAPDGRTLRERPRLRQWLPEGNAAPTLRSDWDVPRLSASALPAFGVGVGQAQTVSVHLGVLLLAFRDRFGAGFRLAAEAGVNGPGASAALVLPYPAPAPALALELGARYARPWSDGASRAWIAPEIGLDLLANLRFTLTLLGLGTSRAAAAGHGAAFGIGWGFF